MKLWIARDKDGELALFIPKPCRGDEHFYAKYYIEMERPVFLYIDSELFPEVTWENSPQQVELKLIEEWKTS